MLLLREWARRWRDGYILAVEPACVPTWGTEITVDHMITYVRLNVRLSESALAFHCVLFFLMQQSCCRNDLLLCCYSNINKTLEISMTLRTLVVLFRPASNSNSLCTQLGKQLMTKSVAQGWISTTCGLAPPSRGYFPTCYIPPPLGHQNK